jgi:hypothetical protein
MQQKARDRTREESMWMQEYAREKKTAKKVCDVMQMYEYHCSFYISRSGGYNIEPENVFFFVEYLQQRHLIGLSKNDECVAGDILIEFSIIRPESISIIAKAVPYTA